LELGNDPKQLHSIFTRCNLTDTGYRQQRALIDRTKAYDSSGKTPLTVASKKKDDPGKASSFSLLIF
jgi:hypothetical protein